MRRLSLLFVAVLIALGQIPDAPPVVTNGQRDDGRQQDVRLPNGKLQRDEIIKADHKRNQEDAAQLAQLAEELKDEMDNTDSHVVSVKTLKKLDDMEKLVKGIRGRLKRN